jgi:hypothetical protein
MSAKLCHAMSCIRTGRALSRIQSVLLILALSALMLLFSIATAPASTITMIDDFTVVESPNSPWLAASPNNYNAMAGLNLRPDLPYTSPIPGNPAVSQGYDESGLSTVHVLGGSRQSVLTVTQSNPPEPEFEIADINLVPSGAGTFSFETGLTAIANTSLTYNGVLPAGADSGTAVVRFTAYDKETASPLLVRLALDDGSGGTGQIDRTLNVEVNPITGDPPFDLTLPLGLGEFAGVNFSNSLKLTFTFFGNMADDFDIDQIFLATDPPTEAPEPSTWAMSAAALVGMVGYGTLRSRRRRRNALPTIELQTNTLKLTQPHVR